MLNLAPDSKYTAPINDVESIEVDIASLIEQSLSHGSGQSFDQWMSEWVYEQIIKLKDRSPEQIKYLAQQAILTINQYINRQLDEVLHHPAFKQLEASWRGLEYLSHVEADYDENLTVKIKVLNVKTAFVDLNDSQRLHCQMSIRGLHELVKWSFSCQSWHGQVTN